MPPKIKISKEQIVQAAYEITKESGVEAATAKAISERLNCSTQPIYWVFETMDKLRQAIIEEAIKKYDRIIFVETPNLSKYQSVGWNYVRFAKEFPHLFRLLFMSERQPSTNLTESKLDRNKDYIISLIMAEYNFDEKNANDMYVKMWLFTHGIATMILTKTVKLDDEDIANMLFDIGKGVIVDLKQKGGKK